MDSLQQTTTSFIPKARLAGPVYRSSRSFGLLFPVSFFLLLVSLALFAGSYFYRQSLQKQADEAVASLETAKKSLEPELINELTNLSYSINTAKTLLGQHQAPSQILKIISDLTLKDVRYSDFKYSLAEKNLLVTMTGEAKSYGGVALQAKLFEESDYAGKAAVSELKLKEGGKVGFSAEVVFNPAGFIYKILK